MDLAIEFYQKHRDEIEREREFKGDIGAFFYCYSLGLKAHLLEPDPLDEALNSGDGVYRP